MNITFPRIKPDVGVLVALLEGLVRANVWYLGRSVVAGRRRGVHLLSLPPLYVSGVRYQPEPRGTEEWLTAPEVYRRKVGDCEDLAAWRAAELRLAGDDYARAIAVRGGKHMWHAVVEHGDGTIEDPSRRLGMKG